MDNPSLGGGPLIVQIAIPRRASFSGEEKNEKCYQTFQLEKPRDPDNGSKGTIDSNSRVVYG